MRVCEGDCVCMRETCVWETECLCERRQGVCECVRENVCKREFECVCERPMCVKDSMCVRVRLYERV